MTAAVVEVEPIQNHDEFRARVLMFVETESPCSWLRLTGLVFFDERRIQKKHELKGKMKQLTAVDTFCICEDLEEKRIGNDEPELDLQTKMPKLWRAETPKKLERWIIKMGEVYAMMGRAMKSPTT
jgi:hypothetical protein